MPPKGLGDKGARYKVFIGNRPSYDFADTGDEFTALETGDIYSIGQSCGNGWRKVFNVYAKLIYALPRTISPVNAARDCWQDYRDNELLQKDSNTALIFSTSNEYLQDSIKSQTIKMIMGKTYANTLVLPSTLVWIDDKFAVDPAHNVIVCPYFDYRQLTNSGILHLVEIINNQIDTHSGSIFRTTHIE